MKKKTLLIMRHAKSSWKHEVLADIDRPLNKRGKQDAPRMGQWLVARNLVPDLILSSPAKRTRSTVKRLKKTFGSGGEARFVDSLYTATSETYIELLADLQYEEAAHEEEFESGDSAVSRFDRVMVVGHNPTLEELLYDLTGETHPLPTAAIAVVEFQHDSWAVLDEAPKNCGRLLELALPREISASE